MIINLKQLDAIALLDFLPILKDMFDICGVCEGGDVLVLAYLLNYGSMNVYEGCNGNGISTDAHDYHWT